MDPFEVECVDDKNFPNELPLNKRPKKGQIYHITKMDYLRGHGSILGVQLEEIDLSDCAPYLYFAASRFKPVVPPEEIEEVELEEMIA